jgi:threonine dehydrogenase-like Zn-dependent dehydrogenase
METMRGVVFLGDREAEVREFPRPEPGPGQVLVQMKRAAVCGSDLHSYRRPKSWFAERPDYIPGHEPAGVVVELGECCRRVQPGDRVTVYHYMACGHCAHCTAGYLQFCDQRQGLGQPTTVGPDADYMVVDERNCLLLPDELSFEDGAYIACIAGTCYSALRKLHPNGEETLLIYGQGPVGLMGTIMAKAQGARVIGIETMPERRQMSRDLGADVVLDPAEGDLAERVRELTHGHGADLALETSGAPAAHASLPDTLRINGRAALVGLGASEPTLNLTRIIGKQITLMGSFVMPMPYYWDLVEFILDHDLSAQFDRLTTHRFSIDQAAEAFRVADSRTAGKIMFVWD